MHAAYHTHGLILTCANFQLVKDDMDIKSKQLNVKLYAIRLSIIITVVALIIRWL